MLIAVCSERSSCPCLCSGVDEESVSRSVGPWNFQGAFPVKEKYHPRSAAMILSGESAAKWIGCVAGRLIFQGWSTARQCSKWTRPHLVDGFKSIHKISGICDREYHGLLGASRWFCKIYCGKATKVCLIWGILFQSLRKYDSFLTDVKKSRNLFSETSRGGAAFQRTKS